jgi:integration host factor subunit alpha
MPLTKESLVHSVHRQLGGTKTQTEALVESLFGTMKKTLASGEDLLISRFGKFSVKDKRERRGRNPRTGEDLTLKARRVVVFQSSPVLKAKLNGQK